MEISKGFTRSKEQFKIVCRIVELNSLKLKNGKLKIHEQIEHDLLVERNAYLSESDCYQIWKFIKSMGNKGPLKLKSFLMSKAHFDRGAEK